MAASVMKIARRLETFERLDKTRQDDFLKDRLFRLIGHAKKFAPYWANRLGAWAPHGESPESILGAVPILSRADLQSKHAEIRAQFPGRNKMKIAPTSSSGSTGIPITTEHLSALHQPMQYAIRLLEARWHEIDPKKPVGFLSSKVTDDECLPTLMPFGWFGPTATGFSRCIKGREYPELYDYCAGKKPAYLVSGPPMFSGLARHAIASGRRDVRPEKVLTYGSAVTEETRELVREGLNAKIVDRYSTEETGMIGVQCPRHDHFHLLSPTAFVEIVDEHDAPCSVGKPGRVLVTNMQSFAMPLIRYDIGDVAEWGEPCNCGITLPVIAKLWGRSNFFVTNPDGRKVYIKIFFRDFDDIVGLQEYRFVLHRNAVVVAHLKVAEPSNELANTVTERIQGVFGYPYPVKVQFEDRIDWGSSWKKENFAVSDEAPPGERS